MLNSTVQWTKQLSTYLKVHNADTQNSAPLPQIEAESGQLSVVAPHRPHLQYPLLKPIIAAQKHADIIDNAKLLQAEPILRHSPLAVQATSRWNITEKHIYRQFPIAPSLGRPLRVGDFLLFPDSIRDSVTLDQHEKLDNVLIHKDFSVSPINSIDSQLILNPGYLDGHQVSHSIVQSPLHLETLASNTSSPQTLAHRWQRRSSQPNNTTALASSTVVVGEQVCGRPIYYVNRPKLQLSLRRAFFTTVIPRKQSFKLVVRRNQQLQVEGGTAYLKLNLYSQVDADSLGEHRLKWTRALANAGHGSRLWKFLPIHLQTMERPSLNLASHLKSHAESIAFDPHSGIVSVIIHLSPMGAQLWQRVFEQRQYQDLTGIFETSVSYYAHNNGKLQAESQTFQTPLVSLLQDCGPEVVHILNPDITVETRIQVEASQMLQSVQLDWQPNQGAAEAQHVFNHEGGEFIGLVRTQTPSRIMVDWSSQVHYQLKDWPILSLSGKLTANNLLEILEPTSSQWVQHILIMTTYMLSPTQVFEEGDHFNDIEIEGVLSLTANYLSKPLTTTVELSNTSLTEIPYPYRSLSSLKTIDLTINTRSRSTKKLLRTYKRQLRSSETFISVKAYPSGDIKIISEQDPLS